MQTIIKQTLLAAALALSLPVCAQIKIGQTAGFTGPVAAGVKEITEGARLYLDAVNAQGGVAGQKIELVSLDDKFDPKLSAPNAKQLIDQGVLALFLTRGTPQSQAILPLLAEHKLALVAPSTGAMLLHKPVNPYVFNVRATYQREAERAVLHLAGMGVKRIGLVQVDDSFGEDGAAGALRGLEASKLKPVAHLKYPRANPGLAPLMKQMAQADAQALIFIGAAEAVAEGVEALRAAGSNAQLVTLSNNASAGFIKLLKGQARGVVVSQVFPSERSLNLPLVREAQALAKARQMELTPAGLEGFTAAKVLVEGLKRAAKDKDLSRAGLLRALDSMSKFDLGGLELNFSPSDHTGMDYADVSIIGPDGKFWR
ncbi:MAG: ABC transporter substrate-binding protein [Roseateles asaccharophilus]|uniref:Amino acid/amide ABC transporter substrate-binding protein (HAAT family) n=1 Tax=Roseateles asaccharophilus TaxID=582607 RepID=A0A4R6N9P1_9BURK|nr:ABC transporter substrate-binding protein [Roseateles asaccharophilus]MDN3543632.1 ABC transporter substrate-binding protein [Roseateles asaccharophilus]TDP11990.1 amino acid/amide ABC transporter substrate-binding protein (HAAT family) [Roseateles asaccharophilus]